jgi:hypothetical protein
MADNDIAGQWKSFDPEKRDRLLKKMTPEQKKKLRGMLESTPTAAASSTPPETPGAAKRLASSFASGAGVVTPEQGKDFFVHPLKTGKGMLEAQGELGMQAGRELKSGDLVHGITHGIEYLIPGMGPTLAHAGKQLEDKDYAGGIGTTLGAATTMLVDPEKVSTSVEKVAATPGALKAKIQPFARKVTQVETAASDAATKAAKDHAQALTENAQKRAGIMRENLDTQRAGETKIQRDKMAVEEKNKGIEAGNKEQAAQVAKRGELAKTVDTQSLELGKHIEKVEASVSKEANAKFDNVRAKIGNPEIAPDALVATVRGIEHDILHDIPENIKEFRAILAHGGEVEEGMRESFKNVTGVEPLGGKPITWDELQSIKSRVDARLRKSQGMNGDLKRSLYQLRDSVVNEHMGQMAEAHGAGALWTDARDFWRNYKEDFHEPTGPSGSGSPVAQAREAVDPKNIRQPFLGKARSTVGNRGVDTLRKYPQHGGNEAATHAEALIKNHDEMLGLPEKESPKSLKTSPESHQLPTPKPQVPRPEAPVVDLDKVARDAIAQKAKNWGSVNARDVGILASGSIGQLIGAVFGSRGIDQAIGALGGVAAYESGKFAMSRVLKNPRVVDWLAKTPPAEMEVLNKIPGADKIKIQTGLTDAAVEAAKTRPVQLSPSVRRFLGPANVARILAVTSVGNQVKTPGEAKQRLQAVAPNQPMDAGMVERGNIDLHSRPSVKNPDGSISTVRSISIEEDGKEVLIPTVVGDRVVSDQEAIREYKRTGKHLGKFNSVEDADRYAEQLHNEQAKEYVH